MQLLTTTKDPLGYEQKPTLQPFDFKMPEKTTNFRGFRDELVDRLVKGINKERQGTKWKPVNHKQIALRINKNPHFTGKNGELELLIKECESRGNYSKFFWACPLNATNLSQK